MHSTARSFKTPDKVYAMHMWIDTIYWIGTVDLEWSFLTALPEFFLPQGHHGDSGAARANIVLPGTAYTEKVRVILLAVCLPACLPEAPATCALARLPVCRSSCPQARLHAANPSTCLPICVPASLSCGWLPAWLRTYLSMCACLSAGLFSCPSTNANTTGHARKCGLSSVLKCLCSYVYVRPRIHPPA